jgi:hypothetical protein
MARVKIEKILDSLSSEITWALEDAIRKVLPEVQVNRDELFKAFKHAVERRVDRYVEVGDCVEESD